MNLIFDLQDIEHAVSTIISHMSPTSTLLLEGEMGCGKTTLIKHIMSRFGLDKDEIDSPTFTKLNIYEGKWLLSGKKLQIYHYDLYMLEPHETIALDIQSNFGVHLCMIEWSNKLVELPEKYIHIQLSHKGESRRQIIAKF